MSKLTFRNVRDYNSAALSIQKKYRGWKGCKDNLAFRKKVMTIQVTHFLYLNYLPTISSPKKLKLELFLGLIIIRV